MRSLRQRPWRVQAGDVAALLDPARIAIATRARLPVAAWDNTEIVVFRSVDDTREHVALVIGRADIGPRPAGAAPFRMSDRRHIGDRCAAIAARS